MAHFHAKPSVSTTIARFKLKLLLFTQRYIDVLIVLDETSKFDLEQSGWKKPIYVIPNFIDASEYSKNLAPVDQREYIVYLGRMSEMKGIFKILEIAALIPGEKFVFIGPFEDRETERNFMARIAAMRNVDWLGPIYGKKKKEYLERAKFLVFPSDSEVFPMTIIECSLCGVITFATPVGLIPNLIKDGETGFFINANTPQQTALIIKKLLLDPARARKISDRCRHEFSEKFTKAVIGPRLLAIIQHKLLV
jgi:glycosyltransferase involved in cell wall biosynthesis